jgi:hypothetical protein
VILTLTGDDIRRFRDRIDRTGDCWLWTGQVNNQGYGRLDVYRQNRRYRILAHRLAFFLETGEDIDGRLIRHSCDTPRCCRGDHLLSGTQLENMRDALARGRLNMTGLAIGWELRRRKAS